MTTTTADVSRRPFPLGILLLGGLVLFALLLALIRYVGGIGAISNLNDNYGWGLWITFDLLVGVALAAGGFTTATAVYILRQRKYRPIARPAILTAFLGYLMVILALLVDLGRPERIWFLLIFWNPESVMFEVGWCVMLYTGVLALEFSPMLFDRFQMRRPLRIIHLATISLVILGTVLSTLHQSSLGSLFLIVPDQLNVLWHSPILPLFFFMSAVIVGPAMVIFESSISSRVFKRGLELDLLGSLASVLPYLLGLYLIVKIADLAIAGELGAAFDSGRNSCLFLSEILFGVILPMILFSLASVRRNPTWLFLTACLVIGGVILNRLDVGLIGLTRPADAASYIPHWAEFMVSIGIWSAGLIAFYVVARNLPLFEHAHHVHRPGKGSSTG